MTIESSGQLIFVQFVFGMVVAVGSATWYLSAQFTDIHVALARLETQVSAVEVAVTRNTERIDAFYMPRSGRAVSLKAPAVAESPPPG